MPTLLAIDGNSLMHRAFHAIPLLTAADGSYTNAVYGFLNMLFRLLKEEGPSHVAVAFDMHGPTFRHGTFAEYKAGRAKTPDELVGQFDILKSILHAMNIPVLEKEGFEADDILGTLSKKATDQGMHSVLVTGDRDALQLVNDYTIVIYTKRGITDTERLDIEGVIGKLGVSPGLVPDLKGLMGDSSDNIPGVPGVGSKTAVKLLNEYGTLDNVLQHAGEAGGPKLCESLVTFADQARMSRELGAIQTDMRDLPELFEIEYDLTVGPAEEAINKLGMTSLLGRLRSLRINEPESQAVEQIPAIPSELETLDNAFSLLEKVRELKVLAIYPGEDGISIADSSAHGYYLPFAKTLLDKGLDESEVLRTLSALFEDASCEKILYDSKALRHRLAGYGLKLMSPIQDIMLMAYVEDTNHGQDGLVKQCQDHGIACEKADAVALWRLYETIAARLNKEDTISVYSDIELPLSTVLFDMEQRGFSIDLGVLQSLGQTYGKQIDALQAEAERLAGHPFNLNSPKQVGTLLFEELHLPAMRKTKSGYSTDAATLEALSDAHPIVPVLLEFRKLSKLKSTYLDGLANVVDKKTGKVYTRFTQNVAATGRISSIEPNLQNIPVRTEVGREIRRAFVASMPGRVILSADYSQIELRLLAHLANEEHMIDVFLNGGDIHTATAAKVFDIPSEQVSREQRSAAKAVNFGIIYGISDFGLARNLGITRAQAGRIIADYMQTYPSIESYMQSCVEFAKKNGYVQTLFKRRRYLPELQSKIYNMRAFGERAAMNAPFQGTAADIIKTAMIRVEAELDEKVPDAKLILQVHDELIVDCSKEDTDRVSEIVRDCMENILPLSVPLLVEIGIGENWLEAK